MGKIVWTQFTGIKPKMTPRLLPDGNAQVADNICTERGGVRPIEGLRDVMPLAKGSVKTIYRFGQALASEVLHWFHWSTEVNVVKGPIADDVNERTYWTGDGAPKYTTAQAGTAGGNLPSGSFPLGVPAPNSVPILTATGTPATGAATETRIYIYTFVTANGEESPPSVPVSINISVGQGVHMEGFETTATNGAVLATKRIYRAQRGAYLFVTSLSSATLTYDDNVESGSLGEVCPSVDWDQPSDTMKGLIAGPNGMMAAIDGNTVRLCEPFRPHAWPMKYAQTLDYPGVGMGQFGQSFVVLTTGLPVILTGTHPGNMSVASAKFYQPCMSSPSIVSAAGSVLWASPDGLVALGAIGEVNLTEELFTPEQWRGLNPASMLGEWHEGWYVGSYLDGATRRSFMFRPSTREWVPLPGLPITAMFRDTVGDALYVCVDNRIQRFRSGAVLPFTWKSQQVVTGLTDFAVARVTGTYPITFKLYKNGRLRLTKTVTSDEPFKLPASLARTWEVEVSGVNEVLGISLGTSEPEL